VEELVYRRKSMCVEMLRECSASAKRLLDDMKETPDFINHIHPREPGRRTPDSDEVVQVMMQSTMDECGALVRKYNGEEPAWFNCNGNLRIAVQDALNLLPMLMDKVKIWMENSDLTAWDLKDVSMRECQMRRISKGKIRLEDAADHRDVQDIIKCSQHLCHLRDLLVYRTEHQDSSSSNMGLESLDGNGETPLYCATIRFGTDCVRLLIDAGANVDSCLSTSAANLVWKTTPKGRVIVGAKTRFSALLGAARFGLSDQAALLLERGANVNLSVSGVGWPAGCSPLMMASANGNHQLVKVLLQHHARTDLTNTENPELRARFQEFADGTNSTKQPTISKNAFLRALETLHDKRDEAGINMFMAQFDFDSKDNISLEELEQVGYTALMLAARNGHSKVTQLLLDAHADKTAVKKNRHKGVSQSMTALDFALEALANGSEGADECVRLLSQT